MTPEEAFAHLRAIASGSQIGRDSIDVIDAELNTLRADVWALREDAQSFGEQFARLKVERQNLKDELKAIKEKHGLPLL